MRGSRPEQAILSRDTDLSKTADPPPGGGDDRRHGGRAQYFGT